MAQSFIIIIIIFIIIITTIINHHGSLYIIHLEMMCLYTFLSPKGDVCKPGS